MIEITSGYIRLINCIISAEKESKYRKRKSRTNRSIQNIRKVSKTIQTKGRITI